MRKAFLLGILFFITSVATADVTVLKVVIRSDPPGQLMEVRPSISNAPTNSPARKSIMKISVLATVRVDGSTSKPVKVKYIRVGPRTFGGHVHPGPPEAKRGTVTPSYGTMSLIRRYLNNTRADYRFNTTYTASEISGRYRFNVQVGGKLSTSAIWVKIPSLVNLAQFSGNWMRVGQTNTHPDNHYVTNEVATALRRLAKDWRKYWNDLPKAERDKYDTSVGTLHINDCSLKLGGLFDINANWSPSHNTHRTGFDTDIRTDKVANSARTGGIPPRVMPNSNFDHKAKFEELVDDAYPGATILHENKGEANPNEHFHIFWIPNRDARRYAGYR